MRHLSDGHWSAVLALTLMGFALRSAIADEIRSLNPVQVTASRLSASIFDVSTAVNVIEASEIDRQMPQVMPDLLRGRAGISVQETTPGQSTPIVRGLKGSEVLYLVDGMRLSNAMFRNAPNQYLALLDPLNIDHLEVIRGPSSALYGGDAMGGVVQVFTPEPKLNNAAGWQSKTRFDNRYASAENAAHTHVRWQGGNDRLAIMTNLGYQSYGNRIAGHGEEQAFSAFSAWAASGKVVYRPADTHEWMLDIQLLHQPKTPRYDELVASYGQTQASSAVFYFEPNERLFVHGRYRYAQATPLFDQLELHVAHQHISDDRRTRDLNAVIETRERNASHLTGITLQAALAHWPQAQLAYGFEYYHDEVTSSRRDTNTFTGSQLPAASRFPNGATMAFFAAYANETISLADRWQLAFGGRYSHYHTVLTAEGRDIGGQLNHAEFSGNAGVSYRLLEGLKLVGNVGYGFRPPNIFDLSTLGQRPGNRFNRPNADLRPETVLTWDFGVKVQQPDWQMELIGYRSDYQDKITTATTGTVTANGRSIVQNINSNTVELHGIEFDTHVFPNNKTELYAVLNYTYGQEIFADGSRVPADRIPPISGRAGMRYVLNPVLWLEGYVNFADRQNRLSDRDRADPRINPNGTPGWATLNLRAGWQFNAHWAFQLHLENLLDQPYREHGSGIDAAGINVLASVRTAY